MGTWSLDRGGRRGDSIMTPRRRTSEDQQGGFSGHFRGQVIGACCEVATQLPFECGAYTPCCCSKQRSTPHCWSCGIDRGAHTVRVAMRPGFSRAR